jgi:hypothetical protein
VALVRVERTLIALGLLLVLVGAIVALNGYVYVNVDRGPPLMVSGVLAFGFGLVLVALGFILRELQAISADASKAALMLAKARPAAAPAAEIASHEPAWAEHKPPLPPMAPFEPPRAAQKSESEYNIAQLDSADEEAQSDLFRLEREEEKQRRPSLPPTPDWSSDEKVKPDAPSPSPPPLPWMVRPGPSQEKLAKPNLAKPEQDDWLNQAIAREAGRSARGKPPAENLARESERALEREFGLGEPEAPAGNPAEQEQTPKPDVIGHYEAHGAHYTMFSDGSIEAETLHGVYRFANIEDLKRFIEGEEKSAP